MLGSPCFHHPRGIETNKFWTNRTLDVQLVISQLRNKKGWIATNRLHFPTRRSKVQIHIGFQVLIAAAFYANLRPDPALLLILAGMGWLLVSLDLWFSLNFIVSGCVCKPSKSKYMTSHASQGKCTHKMKVYCKKTFFLQGNRCFDKKYVKAGTFKMDRPFQRFWEL